LAEYDPRAYWDAALRDAAHVQQIAHPTLPHDRRGERAIESRSMHGTATGCFERTGVP
jgi:hypothetical protein